MLIVVGSTTSRLDITSTTLFEGIDLILGRDWLDALNPLIDWKSNTLFLRDSEGKMEQVEGLTVEQTESSLALVAVGEQLKNIPYFEDKLNKVIKARLCSTYWKVPSFSTLWRSIWSTTNTAKVCVVQEMQDNEDNTSKGKRYTKLKVQNKVVSKRQYWCNSILLSPKKFA